MGDTAIKVENLSKVYRLGELHQRTNSIRDKATETLRRLMQTVRRQDSDSGGSVQDSVQSPHGDDYISALQDVSFEVKKGEIVGIIGRNGAGKSTLLKILSRITKPTKGIACINGRIGSLLEVGTGFHPELTGRENIYLNGVILGMKKHEIDRQFDEIVAFAEIERFLDTPVKRYSSGMYVRLAFAVAAHLEPEILLVDEVLAVGDFAFQKQCLKKMDEVRNTGRTVLYVSHNMGSIADLCARAMYMESGQIMLDGNASEVIDNYLSFENKEGQVDLRKWSTERSGYGPMKITYLSTKNADGQVVSRFKYNEPIVFHFGIRGRTGTACVVGVAIRNTLGQLVLHLNNTDDAAEVVLPREESDLAVRLGKNILNEGTYFITIWLGDGLNVVNDRVGNCLSFTVSTASKGNIRSQGMVRISATWIVK